MDLLRIAEDYKRLLRSMKSGSLPSCSTECPPWAGLCTRAGRESGVHGVDFGQSEIFGLWNGLTSYEEASIGFVVMVFNDVNH